MTPAVAVSHLGKVYRRYRRPSDRLLEWLSGGRRVMHDAFWALRELDFHVPSGQSVGIIGLNGAGKSTLLKLLTGTTLPSEGTVHLSGRVAALLELGMGFHPDFTGRQNALMAGRLMGLASKGVDRLLGEIQDFAEIGDYIDQPIRTYSTGMVARLAFSVATAVPPDVLIVDETLSVGDTYFQHKCVRRLREFKRLGTTIVIVSHDPVAIRTLCDRCLLLDRGRLALDGSPDQVLDYYNALIARREASEEILQQETVDGRSSTRSGTFEARIEAIQLLDAAGQPSRAFIVGERVRVCCTVRFAAAVSAPTVGILIRDRLGNDVFGTNTYHLAPLTASYGPRERLEIEFDLALNIGIGGYTLTAAVHSQADHLSDNYDWWDKLLAFEIVPGPQPSFVGSAWLPTRVTARARPANDRVAAPVVEEEVR